MPSSSGWTNTACATFSSVKTLRLWVVRWSTWSIWAFLDAMMVGWVSFLIYSIPTHWRTVSVFIDKVYVCFIYIRIDGATRPSAKIRVVAGRLRWWNWKGWEGWANCRSGSWTADARPQIENDRKDGEKKGNERDGLDFGWRVAVKVAGVDGLLPAPNRHLGHSFHNHRWRRLRPGRRRIRLGQQDDARRSKGPVSIHG